MALRCKKRWNKKLWNKKLWNKKLWKLLMDREMTRSGLHGMTGASAATLAKMR